MSPYSEEEDQNTLTDVEIEIDNVHDDEPRLVYYDQEDVRYKGDVMEPTDTILVMIHQQLMLLNGTVTELLDHFKGKDVN